MWRCLGYIAVNTTREAVKMLCLNLITAR